MSALDCSQAHPLAHAVRSGCLKLIGLACLAAMICGCVSAPTPLPPTEPVGTAATPPIDHWPADHDVVALPETAWRFLEIVALDDGVAVLYLDGSGKAAHVAIVDARAGEVVENVTLPLSHTWDHYRYDLAVAPGGLWVTWARGPQVSLMRGAHDTGGQVAPRTQTLAAGDPIESEAFAVAPRGGGRLEVLFVERSGRIRRFEAEPLADAWTHIDTHQIGMRSHATHRGELERKPAQDHFGVDAVDCGGEYHFGVVERLEYVDDQLEPRARGTALTLVDGDRPRGTHELRGGFVGWLACHDDEPWWVLYNDGAEPWHGDLITGAARYDGGFAGRMWARNDSYRHLARGVEVGEDFYLVESTRLRKLETELVPLARRYLGPLPSDTVHVRRAGAGRRYDDVSIPAELARPCVTAQHALVCAARVEKPGVDPDSPWPADDATNAFLGLLVQPLFPAERAPEVPATAPRFEGMGP